MAWRIADSVLRGVIDNRERGVVRGEIWLKGLKGPVRLELRGNASPDLAGCRLSFKNPGVVIPIDHGGLNPVQCGTVGDLTASRKVRVLDLPMPEAYLRKKQGLPVPEHMANCLYLEWFSRANGRVVIESTEFQLSISAPTWRLTPEEERNRQRDVQAGLVGFMDQLCEALRKADSFRRSEDQARPKPGLEAAAEPAEMCARDRLVERVMRGTADLQRKCAALKLSRSKDKDLKSLVSGYLKISRQIVAAFKPAGGRSKRRKPVCRINPVQRALEDLRAAQAALERVAPKSLLPAETIAFIRAEFLALRGEMLQALEENRLC